MPGVGAILGPPSPHSNTTRGAGATGSGPPRATQALLLMNPPLEDTGGEWEEGEQEQEEFFKDIRRLFWRGQACPAEGRGPGWWWDGPLWPWAQGRAGSLVLEEWCVLVVVDTRRTAPDSAGRAGWGDGSRGSELSFSSAINLSGSWGGSSRHSGTLLSRPLEAAP